MCQTNQFIIKGMVCQRCISVVQTELQSLGLPVKSLSLGQVSFHHNLDPTQAEQLRESLNKFGFQLLDDRQAKLVQEVKKLVAQLFESDLDLNDILFSEYLSKKLSVDYDVISSSFSACQGQTLEKYIISQRIEKVKEQLVYSRRSISDIAYNLGYSSVAHLSKQFKASTGMNLASYRQMQFSVANAASVAA